MEEKSHLSFPFVFEFNNKIFMIPETCDEKQIRLYKCKKFPLEWELNNILIDNIEAVDSLLIYKNSIWYLITNICSAGLEKTAQNYIFFGIKIFLLVNGSILEKQFQFYLMQKKRETEGYLKKTELYRISQNHQPNNYGSSFNINQIEEFQR